MELTKIIVEILTNLIQKTGLAGVFVLMTAESALIPIPSEVTMPFAGFLSSKGVFGFWQAVFVGALGNLAGSLLAFYLGLYKGEEWVRFAIKKWGKFLLLRETEFDRSKKWFQNHGQIVTFTSRLLPIVRTFISLPAGIAKMNIVIFTLLTFLGSFIWSGILAWFGFKLGENWLVIEPFFRKFQILIVMGGVVLVVLYVRHHIKNKNK